MYYKRLLPLIMLSICLGTKNTEEKDNNADNGEDKEKVKKKLSEIGEILLTDVAFSAFFSYFNLIVSFLKAKNSNEIEEQDLKDLLSFLVLENSKRKTVIGKTLVDNFFELIKLGAKSVPELIKYTYNLFLESDNKMTPQKIKDIFPNQVSSDKMSIQEYANSLSKDRKEELIAGIVERYIDNVKEEDLVVHLKVDREKLRDEIFNGKFENIPENMCIEDDFVDFVLKYKSKVTVDEYNNLAEFISIVKNNKKVDHIKEMQEKALGNFFFLNNGEKELNWISLFYHGGNYLVKNYDQLVKELAEIKKDIETLEDKVDPVVES